MDRRQFFKKGCKVAAITAVTPFVAVEVLETFSKKTSITSCGAICSDSLGRVTGIYVLPEGMNIESFDKKLWEEKAIKIQ